MSWLTNLIELLFGKPPQRKRKATEPEKDTVATPIEDLEPKGAPGNKPYGDVAASAQLGHAKTEARTPAPSSAIVEAAGAFSPEVVILVPEFKNDREAGFTNRVLETLRAARMLNVRSVERGISSPGDRPNVAKLALFYAEARAALHEQSADVLLYGEVLRNGLRMRMVSAVPSGEARMGDFGIGDALMVPHNFGSELANLVYAGVLAAALPAKPDHHDALTPYLVGAAEQSMKLLETLPDSVDPEQIGSIFTYLGVVCGAKWRLHKMSTSLVATVASFEKASNEGPSELAPLAMAELKIRLGIALQELASVNNDADMFEESLDAYETVTSALDPSKNPREWGLAYMCLGNAFLSRGKTELSVDDCDRANAAFDASMKVFTKEKDKPRWLDAMTAKGAALMTAGAIHTGTKELEAATDVLREVLKERDRRTQPLPWAQASNGLGSAAFALAKRTQNRTQLDEAIACFDGAISIYESLNQTVAIGIVRKNQQRAYRLRETIGN
ncbi:MAG: hypothetical protein HOH04_02950 [Rhodospirillaceae bacterium]|nr:hypothetical protein [Rhodospirillaceae bacterium]